MVFSFTSKNNFRGIPATHKKQKTLKTREPNVGVFVYFGYITLHYNKYFKIYASYSNCKIKDILKSQFDIFYNIYYTSALIRL